MPITQLVFNSFKINCKIFDHHKWKINFTKKKNFWNSQELGNSDQNRIFYGYVLLFWTKNKSSKEDHSFSLKKGRHHLFQGEGTSCVKMPWRIKDILLAAYQKKWRKKVLFVQLSNGILYLLWKKATLDQLKEEKKNWVSVEIMYGILLSQFLTKISWKSTVSSEWIFFHIVLYRDSFRCLTRFGAKVGQVGTVQKFKNFSDFFFEHVHVKYYNFGYFCK